MPTKNKFVTLLKKYTDIDHDFIDKFLVEYQYNNTTDVFQHLTLK